MIDTEKLKAINPEIILNALDISYKRTGSRLMATATYREEQTPSISIQEKNGRYLWIDFGTGQGGSWIDLVMAVKDLNYIDAIKFLNNIESYGNAEVTEIREKTNFFFGGQEKRFNKNTIKISSISDVTDKGLINYLHSRAISFMPDWLEQIGYLVVKNNLSKFRSRY